VHKFHLLGADFLGQPFALACRVGRDEDEMPFEDLEPAYSQKKLCCQRFRELST
jgi:hypothetical protein